MPAGCCAGCLTSAANIIPGPAEGILRIQLLGLGSDACDRMLAPLIAELDATRTPHDLSRDRTQARLRVGRRPTTQRFT